MRGNLPAIARGAPPGQRESASADGRRRVLCAAAVACAILILAAGGCGTSRLKIIMDESEFNAQVLKADRPVVVQFSKGGCVWCMFMDSRMDQLLDEYQDRVVFARFELVTGWGRVTSETLWKRYRIAFYPTAILFVSGKEKKRWVVDYNADNYRKVLDEVAGPPIPKKAPVAQPAAR